MLRSVAASRLGDLARRLECRFTWDDLILPEELLTNLKHLVTLATHSFGQTTRQCALTNSVEAFYYYERALHLARFSRV